MLKFLLVSEQVLQYIFNLEKGHGIVCLIYVSSDLIDVGSFQALHAKWYPTASNHSGSWPCRLGIDKIGLIFILV
jgi:hypothetical protein